MRENRNKTNKKYFKGNEKYIIVDLTYEIEDEKIIKEKFNILDRCMNNLSYNTSIHEAVSIIRTIFKD